MAGIPRHQGRADPKIGPSDSSDTYCDRPNEPTTDTDAEGTGNATVGNVRPPKPETATDRVAKDTEVGLGGGLDQAEEGQLGVTDEELGAEEAQAESDRLKTRKP
jgi:hypothetical protein